MPQNPSIPDILQQMGAPTGGAPTPSPTPSLLDILQNMGGPPATPQDQNSLMSNIYESAANVARNYTKPIITLGEAIESAENRDWAPLGSIAQEIGRGLLQIPDYISAGMTQTPEIAQIQAPAIQQLRQERIAQSPALQDIERRNQQYEQFAARNPSTKARIARGTIGVAGQVAPVAVLGTLTGGSIPAMAAVTAFQAMGEPSTLPLNVAFASVPPPGVDYLFEAAQRAITPAVRKGLDSIEKVLGKGASQVVEADIRATAEAEAQTGGSLQSGPIPPTSNPDATAVALSQGGAALQSAFKKLGTQDPQAITQMLTSAEQATAETEFVPELNTTVKRLPKEIAQSKRDFKTLMSLTPDEESEIVKFMKTAQGTVDVTQPTVPTAIPPPGQAVPVGQIGGMVGDLGASISESFRKNLIESVERTGKLPAVERTSSIGRAFDAAVASGSPPNVETLNNVFKALENQSASVTGPKLFAAYDVGPPPGPAEVPPPGPSAGGGGGPTEPPNGPPTGATGGTGGGSTGGGGGGGAEGGGPEPSRVDATVGNVAAQMPKSTWRKIMDAVGTLGDIPNVSRSLRSAGDASFLLRQGAFLVIPPTRWPMVYRALGETIANFKESNFIKFANELAQDLTAQIGMKSGLQLTSIARTAGERIGEEGIFNRITKNLPIIKQSDQAYSTFLDYIRYSAFKSVKNNIDRYLASLNPDELAARFGNPDAASNYIENMRADKYREAAYWINTITGRGSIRMKGIGPLTEQIMPALNAFYWAPRLTISRFQLLNPLTYIRNATSGAGLQVLKTQMSDMLQSAAVILTGAYLAQAAGAKVQTNFHSADFLKIRFGNWHYDFGAGVTQTLRVILQVGAALNKRFHGQVPLRGEGVIDVSEHFLRSKLAPIPAWFYDAFQGYTYTGQKFNPVQNTLELAVPLAWSSLVEGMLKEGYMGIPKASPDTFGLSTQYYPPKFKDTLIEEAAPLWSEYYRLNKGLPAIKQNPGESDRAFQGRLQLFGQSLKTFGPQLVTSPQYQSLNDPQKVIALHVLSNNIESSLNRQQFQIFLDPQMIVNQVLKNQSTQQIKIQRQQQKNAAFEALPTR